MKLLPMDRLGPREQPDGASVRFGMLLPWVSAEDNNKLFIKIIHEEDQFRQEIQPERFELAHSLDDEYGDYWSGTVAITSEKAKKKSHWGQRGRYLYRFELESPLLPKPLDWIVDPYAREFGLGRQAAFTFGYKEYQWKKAEQTWKTPALHDLIVYELMVHEFAQDLKGASERLPYLKDLGVNAVELMPVANVARSIDWGFEPIGPFGLDERFGKRQDLCHFVETAHENGIAVVLDMIYGHTGRNFVYEQVYNALNYRENPFMGPFAKDMFGPSVDYNRTFAQDFYYTANYFWLDRCHTDGVRYDCVPNYYEHPLDKGYANLVYSTYQKVKSTQGKDHWQRFFNNGDGDIRLIQCAEQLEAPIEIVTQTYSNCTWQNETMNACKEVAGRKWGPLYQLGQRLGLDGYPVEITNDNDHIYKSAFQYLESHDHSRFICRFGTNDLYRGGILLEGNRDNWYKLQPYMMGLFLGKGIPMLWQGQEIVESYSVPDDGAARIGQLRPVRWELFYDEAGQGMIRLVRALSALRRDHEIFRRGEYFFYNNWDAYQSKGVLVFSRSKDAGHAVAALNFTDSDIDISLGFPAAGDYKECLSKQSSLNLVGVAEDTPITLTVPSNYGRIYLRQI